MKDVEKEPLASVAVVATIDPSKVMVTLEEAAKPESEAVTDEPIFPEVGFRVSEGLLVTVKVAVARLRAASKALIV